VLSLVGLGGSSSCSAKSMSTIPNANSMSCFHLLKFEPVNISIVALLLFTAKVTVSYNATKLSLGNKQYAHKKHYLKIINALYTLLWAKCIIHYYTPQYEVKYNKWIVYTIPKKFIPFGQINFLSKFSIT